MLVERPVNQRRFMDSPDVLASFSSDFPRVNPGLVDVRDDIDRSTLSVVTDDGRGAAATSLVITECKS